MQEHFQHILQFNPQPVVQAVPGPAVPEPIPGPANNSKRNRLLKQIRKARRNTTVEPGSFSNSTRSKRPKDVLFEKLDTVGSIDLGEKQSKSSVDKWTLVDYRKHKCTQSRSTFSKEGNNGKRSRNANHTYPNKNKQP